MRVSAAQHRQAGGQTGRVLAECRPRHCGKRAQFAIPFAFCAGTRLAVVFGWFLAAWAAAGLAADAPATAGADRAAPASGEVAKPKDQTESIRSLTARLGVGEGATIVDLGAGRGADTWRFADVVGATGKVYAQDITERSVESIEKEAENRRLSQVETILG